jgi:DMSO/TMAO reductase YedYZ molybdopterin-dependent catalytic subunit
MAEPPIIKSSDTLRKDRVPPGQVLVKKWPVLHEGSVPAFEPAKWGLRLFGLVEKERRLAWPEFKALPRVQVLSDIHCVTRWTMLNVLWEGVAAIELAKLVQLRPEARFVMVHATGGYSANLSLAEFTAEDVIFAEKVNHQPLTPKHGGPVRLVAPRLYLWKSAKWVTGIEFMKENQPGFWESRGYNLHGDPWKEERYAE